MQVIAPAKINLSLRVLGRRDDGFHEIETCIAPISVFDEIKIERCSGKRKVAFACDDPSVPEGEQNSVVCAANVFFDRTKISSGVSIELKKRIPHGAGLGGGSSDAASTLLALNELFETKLPRQTLAKMAAEIGSDVPFFIFRSAAVCKGRGELVAPSRLRKQLLILLLKECLRNGPTLVGEIPMKSQVSRMAPRHSAVKLTRTTWSVLFSKNLFFWGN